MWCPVQQGPKHTCNKVSEARICCSEGTAFKWPCMVETQHMSRADLTSVTTLRSRQPA